MYIELQTLVSELRAHTVNVQASINNTSRQILSRIEYVLHEYVVLLNKTDYSSSTFLVESKPRQ